MIVSVTRKKKNQVHNKLLQKDSKCKDTRDKKKEREEEKKG